MFQKLRAHLFLTTAFALATVLALFLLVKVIVNFAYWEAHQNEPIRPWMTVRYIDKSWDLPPGSLDVAADLPAPREGKPLTLREIAEIEGVPVQDVILKVEQALVALGARPEATSAAPDAKAGQSTE